MIRKIAGAITLLLLIDGCEKEEDFPAEPQITFESMRFVKGMDTGGSTLYSDTVVLTIGITDGDKDFGLDKKNPEHTADPFQAGFFFNKRTGAFVSSNLVESEQVSKADLLAYDDHETPPYDTLPDYTANCYNTVHNEPFETNNLFYYRYNPNSRSIFLSAFVQSPGQSFENIEDKFFENRCQPSGFLDMVSPPIADLQKGKSYINTMLSIDMEKSKKRGKLIISIPSRYWTSFGSQVKIFVSVQDRALHKSNTIETPALTLE